MGNPVYDHYHKSRESQASGSLISPYKTYDKTGETEDWRIRAFDALLEKVRGFRSGWLKSSLWRCHSVLC